MCNERDPSISRVRVSPTSDQVNTCKFSMYIYPAGVLAICHQFFFSFEMFISHLSQFVKKKIANDDHVLGQCVLLGSLTSLVCPRVVSVPFYVSWVSQWKIRLPQVLRLWNGQFLCVFPIEQFVIYMNEFPYRDNLCSVRS